MSDTETVTFDFDGAEGIAFWVTDPRTEDSIPITFGDLTAKLLPFLAEHFPWAQAKAEALREYAEEVDREAAEEAARDRVADVRCSSCDLRYAERADYSCHEHSVHVYRDWEMTEAAEVRVEPTYDGDQLRDRADRIEVGQ